MNRTLARISISAMLLAGGAAAAAEHTVTLAVEKMTCASCPYIVKQALTRVAGVSHVDVSFEQKRAVVTFDDAKTDVAALTRATGAVGFPSRLLEK